LVSIRLVSYENGTVFTQLGENGTMPSNGGKVFTSTGTPLYVGKGDGVTIRRDVTGRVIVDVVISPREGSMIQECYNYMNSFDNKPLTALHPDDVPYAFSSSPVIEYAAGEVAPRVFAVVEICGIAFNQGVNEMQTLANLSASREVTRQVDVNFGSLTRFIEYYRNYKLALEYQLVKRSPELVEILNATATQTQANIMSFGAGQSTSRASASLPAAVRSRRKSIRSSVNTGFINNTNEGLSQTVETLKSKVLNANDRMMDQVHEAIANSTAVPHEKHVDVLLKTSALCREMSGIIAILCKSGKDRTGMSVTLENARSLVEDLGVLYGQEICQTMRQYGVRRMNVFANTGQSMFAFNQIQRIALPCCYRPPPGSHAGNVIS